MRQIFFSVCLVCGVTLGCYSTERKEKKKRCQQKDGNKCFSKCPISPTQPNSHGFCDEHFQGEMERIRQRQLKEMSNG